MNKCKWCGKFIKRGKRKLLLYCQPPATCGEKYRKAMKNGAKTLDKTVQLCYNINSEDKQKEKEK